MIKSLKVSKLCKVHLQMKNIDYDVKVNHCCKIILLVLLAT